MAMILLVRGITEVTHDVADGISKADKLKISSWKYAPDEELYLKYKKYKKVFKNPKYFDQATGDIRLPGQYGDANIDGFF